MPTLEKNYGFRNILKTADLSFSLIFDPPTGNRIIIAKNKKMTPKTLRDDFQEFMNKEVRTYGEWGSIQQLLTHWMAHHVQKGLLLEKYFSELILGHILIQNINISLQIRIHLHYYLFICYRTDFKNILCYDIYRSIL